MTDTTSLPNELILHVLQYSPPHTLWTSARLASKQLRLCTEDVLRSNILPQISLSLTFSLGGGPHHRWYDVRATLAFCFSHLTSDKATATFKLSHVLPSQCHTQALDKWYRLRADNATHSLSAWRAELDGRTYSVPLQLVQVCHEQDGEVSIDINWKAMLSRYFREADRAATRLRGTAAG